MCRAAGPIMIGPGPALMSAGHHYLKERAPAARKTPAVTLDTPVEEL